MTLKDLMASDVNDVFLNTDEHADDATHWPKGVEANAATVTIVFNAVETRRELTRGEEFVFRAEITLSSSVTVHRRDVWIVNGNSYQVLKIGDPEEGARIIEIQRNDIDHVSRPGSGKLL